MVDEVCFYCRQTEGGETCQDCGLVAACADPQHWDLHRWGDIRQESSSLSGKCFRPDGVCLPFRVSNTEEKGNIIVAVRDIKPFETILIDTPAIIGPFDDTLPECPECYREVSVSGYQVRRR